MRVAAANGARPRLGRVPPAAAPGGPVTRRPARVGSPAARRSGRRGSARVGEGGAVPAVTARDESDECDDHDPGPPPSSRAGSAPAGAGDGDGPGPLLPQGRIVSRVRAGGRVTAVRLRGELGGYTVGVEVGWDPGVRYTVATYARAVKFYRSASLAIGMVRSSYRYRGEIVVEALPTPDDEEAVGEGVGGPGTR